MAGTTLVTGASGFLGKEIATTLAKNTCVVGCGHSQAYNGQTLDLRDADATRTFVAETAPEVVVHCAAYRDPDFCETHPQEARRLNVDPVQTFRDCLPNDTYLIFISTDYVFSGSEPPYQETNERGAINVYGQTKGEAEDIVATRPNSVSLRVPVLIGAGTSLDTSGYIGQLIRTARDTTPTKQDHVHMRYPTWIHDVACVVDVLIQQRPDGVVHYCGEEGATRYESALETARLLGVPGDHIAPDLAPTPKAAERPKNSALCTDKIRDMGFTQFTPFGDVVRHVIKACGQ